jgi:hypothetical protein
MKITAFLALLGVATFAVTVAWLILAGPRRRTVVVVRAPQDWVVQRVGGQNPAPPTPRRNTAQSSAIPRLRVVA